MTGSDDADVYAVPRPSKIRLKETKSERAQKLYDREVRRQKRKDHLISRANGYAVSPPRSTSRVDESITPPRTLPRSHDRRPEDEQRERERMEWLEQEEMDRLESNPFASYEPAIRIPTRYKPAPSTLRATAGSSSRDAMRELRHTARGRMATAPDLGMMDDDEYTSFIRDGMDRLRRLAELDEREARAREAERAADAELRREDREREKREDRRRKRAERRRDKQKQYAANDKGAKSRGSRESSGDTDADVVELVRDSKSIERARYIQLWQSLPGEIQQVEMRYTDIPWPVYTRRPLEKADIKEFLFDLAREEGKGQPTKKVLRDAIRIFHPDRFFGRFLARVRDSEKERVKEGVEKCSRVINDLAAEEASR